MNNNTNHDTVVNHNSHNAVYRRAAAYGLPVGALMSLTFWLVVESSRIPAVALLALVSMFSVPVVIYTRLARDYRSYTGMASFSAVWMEGIATFFFGGLLMALFMYFYLRFVEPTFMIDTLRQAIADYRKLGVPEMAQGLQNVIDNRAVPSAIELAVSTIWSTTFFGSMTSLALTVAVRIFNKQAQ